MTLHQRTHPAPVDGCRPCAWASVRLSNWARSPRGEAEILSGAAAELEVGRYKAARAQGIQPRGSRLVDVEHAEQESHRLGRAYDAADPVKVGELVD